MAMERLRVATLQYWVRPITEWRHFHDQVRGLVRTAADYDCRLLVFPEYFTVQLLTLNDVDRPMDVQIRELAGHEERFVEMMSGLARETGLYIVAGSLPTLDPHHADKVYNDSFLFGPDGQHGHQGKLHMTRFEKSVWRVSPRRRLHLFETDFGRLAITICYDVEFPEIARAAARQGAVLLIVPSYTDDRQGYLRVRTCAHARAIENQMYVINAGTVGSLPMVPAVSLNWGQASILTPSDFPFARDGVLAEGLPNQETMVIGELNLRTIRSNRVRGTVLPLRDSQHTHEVVGDTQIVSLLPSSTALSPREAHRLRRRVRVRTLREEDFGAMIELSRQIYPDVPPWSEEQLRSHLAVFPEGQLVAVDETSNLLLGTCSSLIIDWDDYGLDHDWPSLTANGTFTNHDPINGRTLYAADVMVRPGQQGRGVGKRLYKEGRFGLARHLGLLRIRAGARLRGYHRHAKAMTAEQYVEAILEGRIRDPTLSFQLKQGFSVIGVTADYFAGDPQSLGWAAVIEWVNPDVADQDDQDDRPDGADGAPAAGERPAGA